MLAILRIWSRSGQRQSRSRALWHVHTGAFVPKTGDANGGDERIRRFDHVCRLHQWRLWCEERELQGVARLSPMLAARCDEAFHTAAVSPSAMQGAVAEALESIGMSPLHEVSK